MSLFLKRSLMQISMVSTRGMLLKSESISKLPIKLQETCSKISVAKLNGSKIGTKYFASLYVGVCKANKIGLKGGQPFTHFLCTLQEPYIVPGLVPTGFRCLRVSSDILLKSTRFLKIFINVFFLTGNKIQKNLAFNSSFLKFTLIISGHMKI